MINEKTYEKISIPAMGGNRESAWEEFAEKEYQSPRWGAIAAGGNLQRLHVVSIPAMGGNRFAGMDKPEGMTYQSPRWGAIDQDYVGRFHYNRKRQLCQARPHLTCTNRTSLKERTCLISNS
ncbi:unknown [Clostridium sp. CAG:138]|nr:unknown [Clostridium sp. CAG:138]